MNSLPVPRVLGGHYRDHTDKVHGWSKQQMQEAWQAGFDAAVKAFTDPENQPTQWGTVLLGD